MIKYKDKCMNLLHEKLAKTGVISTDFKWQIEQLALQAVREACERGKSELLAQIGSDEERITQIWINPPQPPRIGRGKKG